MTQPRTINPNDVTVVMQGPLTEDTGRLIVQTKKALGTSHLILSTWTKPDPSTERECAHVVISEDPGSYPIDRKGTPNNLNRQIVSTCNGLQAVETPYALKLRTDCGIVNDNLLRLDISRNSGDGPRRAVFHHKVVIPRFATKNEFACTPFLFHPSDVAAFGLTEDIRRLYDHPLAQSADWNLTETSANHRVAELMKKSMLVCKNTPEQYLFLSAIRSAGFDIHLHHPNAFTEDLAAESRLWMQENFVVLAEEDFGLEHTKPKLREMLQKDHSTYYRPTRLSSGGRTCDDDIKWSALDLAESRFEPLLKHLSRCELARKNRHFSKFIEEMLLALIGGMTSFINTPAALLETRQRRTLLSHKQNEAPHC